MKIALFLYFGFVLPYLMGRVWHRLLPWRQSHIGIATSHGMGMLALFAVFYVASFLPLSRGMSVDVLSHWMLRLGLVLGVVCLLILNRKLWTDFQVEHLPIYVVAPAILLLLLSVFALRPDSLDVTGELVRRMVDSNVFYGVKPYSGAAWEGTNHSPIEAIYGIGAVLADMDATLFLHRVIPCVLLLSYFGIYVEAGNILFENDSKSRNIFLVIAMSFFLLEAFRRGPVLINVLCNSWNGQTLLGSMVLPMAFAIAYYWLRTKRWQAIPAELCFLISAQLCFGDGAMMVLFLCGITVIVAFIMHCFVGRTPK